MEAFMRGDDRPSPDRTRAWLSLGASLACYSWRRDGDQWINDGVADPGRALFFSSSLQAQLDAALAGLRMHRVATDQRPPPGELRDFQAAGYRNHFGIAATHRFFHSPGDTVGTTGPGILEPVARAFANAIQTLDQ